MALGEQELSVILQAAVDHARQRIAEEGGIMPFGARALPDGRMEMLEFVDDEGRSVEDLHGQVAQMLAAEARADAILGGAIVAGGSMTSDEGMSDAIAVQVEAPGFCRLIIVPYEISGEGVELGKMIPQSAEPLIYGN